MAKKQVSQDELIADLKAVAGDASSVTRVQYRRKGKFGDAYERYFNTFEEFRTAAALGAPQVESEIKEDATNMVITLPHTDIQSYKELVTKFNIDEKVWEVKRFNATFANTNPNAPFRVVAFLRKRVDTLAIEKELEELREQAKQNSKPPKVVYQHKEGSKMMLEINIPDAHFGKLAWPEETGYEPYDIKIAPAMYTRAVDDIIQRHEHFHYDHILYVIGNDALNADDLEGRTTSGTVVTNDARYHKVFSVVRNTSIATIEKLRRIAPVKVIVVYGNHDQLSAWHLGDSLQGYFHTYDDVEVDNTPKQRKYHEFGVVMLGFTHGHMGNKEDYPLLMATEEKDMWGRTSFREMHTGHLHKTQLDEKHGVRVRILPALCPADDWHSENAFVGNLRNAEAYTWSATDGLLNISIFNDQSKSMLSTESKVVLVT